MATKGDLIDDMYERCGALLTITAISEYSTYCREKVRLIINKHKLKPVVGKRYFYKDVMEALIKEGLFG